MQESTGKDKQFAMDQEEKAKIDQYLDNVLTGSDLKIFMDRFDVDDRFRDAVSFQNLLREGILHSENERLKTSIEKFIGYKKQVIPSGLKFIFVFMIITVSGIVLWNYVGQDFNSEMKENIIVDFLKNHKKVFVDVSNPNETHGSEKKPESRKAILISDSSDKILNEFTPAHDTSFHEMVIIKDQLLYSQIIKPIVISTENKEAFDSSFASRTSGKLNPLEGIPEERNTSIDRYQVEFWKSPVNYKGYKLLGDKLILFGIEKPDDVQIYFVENMVWMKYGDDFFTLHSTEQFESFIASSQIPFELK